jgi:hypothetical protein
MKGKIHGLDSCDTCWRVVQGLDDTITVTIQKGIKDETQKLQFCDEICFLIWILKTADIKKVFERIQEAVEVIREKQEL